MRLTVAVAVACLIGGISLANDARASIKKQTNIPAQNLGTALQTLARERDVQVVYFSQSIDTLGTQGAVGELTIDEALGKLLSGSGLVYRYLGENTITIVPQSNGIPASEPTTSRPSAGMRPQGEQRKSFWDRLHIAQADAPSPSPGEGRGGDERPAQSQKRVEVEEVVVVTGSHIRGAQPAGSKVIVLDREAIDTSGYGRIQDVLGTLTQTFQGVSEQYTQLNSYNFNRGNEVQLRGLGPGTTLTLVNGQRQALGGEEGTMLDISSIATSAIERIEVLPEGASALYGSDAIGGVVNVILRKDFEGSETRARVGTAGGEADERLFAQLFGTSWSSGHVLVGYQYNDRDALPASSRDYSAANGDFRRFGGKDFRTFGSNPGTITIGTQRYAIPGGQDGANLTLAQLTPGTVNYTDNVTYTSLLPKQQMHSAFLNASVELTDKLELSVDGRHATRDFENTQPQIPVNVTVPASNAFNRFGSPVIVAYDFTDDLGPYGQRGTTETSFISTGISAALPGSWQLKVTGSYAKERNAFHWDRLNTSALSPYLSSSNPTVALNVFGDGSHTNPATLAALYRHDYEQGTWTTSSANVTADGPLFDLPSGAVRLAVGADYRKEHLLHIEPADRNEREDLTRNVSAVFAELAIPLVGSANRSGGANMLELSLAGRYEDYSDVGNTLNPKIGVNLRPWDFIKLRSTWGTSFRAPPFFLTDSSFGAPYSFSRFVPDPKSTASNGLSQALLLAGPYPDIKEEKADVLTVGLDLTPSAIENLSVSLTYFDIDYRGKIQIPGSSSVFLPQESLYASLVTRNPTQAQVDAICNSPSFLTGPCVGSFAAIIDGRTRNLAKVTTRGLDADVSYAIPTSIGRWGFGVRGTYTIDYKTQLTNAAPQVDVVDTVNNPLAVRFSGRMSWGLQEWSAQAAINYTGDYKDVGSTPARKVASWTTFDLSVGYRMDTGKRWYSGTQIYLTALNLIDKDPPFVNSSTQFGYDTASANLLGRQVGLQVVKAW